MKVSEVKAVVSSEVPRWMADAVHSHMWAELEWGVSRASSLNRREELVEME